MNRYPLWKYVVMLVALVIGLVYTLPNFFGEAPAVQVSSGKATVKLDTSTLDLVESRVQPLFQCSILRPLLDRPFLFGPGDETGRDRGSDDCAANHAGHHRAGNTLRLRRRCPDFD